MKQALFSVFGITWRLFYMNGLPYLRPANMTKEYDKDRVFEVMGWFESAKRSINWGMVVPDMEIREYLQYFETRATDRKVPFVVLDEPKIPTLPPGVVA